MELMRVRKRSDRLGLVVPLLGAFLGSPGVSWACPLCKDAISADPVAAAFNGTTLLMIAAPTLLVSAVGGWIGYVYWQHARRVEAAAAAREITPAPAS